MTARTRPQTAGRTGTRTRRRVRRGTGKMLAGGVIVSAFVMAAVCAPWITSGDPLHQDLLNRLATPSGDHVLGTDQLGRDVWTQLVYATRIDLRVGLLGAFVPAVIGSVVGAVSALAGGAVDATIMRISDMVVSLPLFVFFLALVGLVGPGDGWLFLGPGGFPIVIGFAIISWVVYARLMRAEIRRVLARDYVRAAETSGLPRRRVVVWHVLPNAVGQTIVYVFVDIGLAIVAVSTLAFLGIGIPIGTPEWGSMINASRGLIQTNWWLVAAPGLAIAALATGFALIGDGIDDRLKA